MIVIIDVRNIEIKTKSILLVDFEAKIGSILCQKPS